MTDAHALADRLKAVARGLRTQGLDLAADYCDEAATLLRSQAEEISLLQSEVSRLRKALEEANSLADLACEVILKASVGSDAKPWHYTLWGIPGEGFRKLQDLCRARSALASHSGKEGE